MKLRFQPALFYATVIFGAIVSLNGCAATGMNRSVNNGNAMQTVDTGMARGESKTGCETGCDLK